MTNQPHKKVLHVVIILALAGMLVLILWLTVFSRLGRESRHFYPPFWSYKAILNGSGKALIEDVGNIILFFPRRLGSWSVLWVENAACDICWTAVFHAH